MTVIDVRDGIDPIRVLTRQLIQHADRADKHKRHGVYFVSSANEFSALARSVEREVFGEIFANDAHTMDEEYGPFEESSDFILVVDHSIEEPTGVLRVIHPSDRGLKTLNDVESDPRWARTEADFVAFHQPEAGMGGVHDMATFAVRGGWTGAAPDLKSSHALYAGLYWWSIANDIELLIGAIDENVAGLLAAVSIPLEPLCGLPAVEYLGSAATRPYVISLPEARRLTRVDPDFRAMVVGELVIKDFSFPAIELDDVDLDLQAEFHSPTHTEVSSPR